jgi:hypothetical protein
MSFGASLRIARGGSRVRAARRAQRRLRPCRPFAARPPGRNGRQTRMRIGPSPGDGAGHSARSTTLSHRVMGGAIQHKWGLRAEAGRNLKRRRHLPQPGV